MTTRSPVVVAGSPRYAEPAQPGGRQDHRVDHAFSRSLDPGLDVAPNRYDVQLEIPADRPIEDLHLASWRAGPDPHAIGQIIEPATHEHITGVLARRNRDDLQILRGRGRQVLQRVHRDIDFATSQGIAYGADEHPGAADLGEMPLINIAGGRDADEAGLYAAGRQGSGDLVRLRAGQRGPTRAEPDRPGAGTVFIGAQLNMAKARPRAT